MVRTRLRFHARSRLGEVPTQQRTTPTGHIGVSTREATALDLAARPTDAGGLDNVATVLVELAEDEKLDIGVMADATESSTVSALRRVGWMLEQFTDLNVTEFRGPAAPSAPTTLDPHGGCCGPIDADWSARSVGPRARRTGHASVRRRVDSWASTTSRATSRRSSRARSDRVARRDRGPARPGGADHCGDQLLMARLDDLDSPANAEG